MNLADLYSIGAHTKFEITDDPSDFDPRGLLLILEPPSPKEIYCMGVDPTVGVPGWNRHLRTRDDIRIDNGAIEVIKIGKGGKPDVQVAEYAAPIDPEDLADVADALGRFYAGSDDSGQCLCVIEVWPGPGLLTQRRMINTHGYYNHFVWKYLDTVSVYATNSLGWQSSPKSVRDLWIRGTRFICLDKVKVLSPWLCEEMAHCESDAIKMTAKAASGKHDDRVRAFLMALWAAHDWTYQLENVPAEVVAGKVPNWQASDISLSRMWDAWADQFDAMQEEQ